MEQNTTTVDVTSVFFRTPQSKINHEMQTFPRRIVYNDQEFTFADSGIQFLIKKGKHLIRLFDMTDGQRIFRLRLENDQWTLIRTRRLSNI